MYAMSSDTRTQLRFLEKLDHMEKERKDEEQREILLRAAKVREFGKVCYLRDLEQQTHLDHLYEYFLGLSATVLGPCKRCLISQRAFT